MPDGRRSSSSRKAALLVLTSVLGMAGCTAGAGLLAGRDGPGELRLVDVGLFAGNYGFNFNNSWRSRPSPMPCRSDQPHCRDK